MKPENPERCIFQHRLIMEYAQTPFISMNGKYRGLYFGEMTHDGNAKQIGFKIYDIVAGKPLYEIEAKNIGGAFAKSTIMVFRVLVDSNHSTYYVFDSITGLLYEKTYDRREMGLLKRFDEEGAVFVLLPDAERTERYDSHFKVVKK
jgi:hypothetical protein